MGTGTTETPRDSLWPPLAALRDTALLLVALLLVAVFADGDLALLLAVVLVVAWALLSFRGPDSDELPVPLWFRLVPLFVAIVVADQIADEHWYPFTLVAVAAPLFVLARVGLVLQRRRRVQDS